MDGVFDCDGKDGDEASFHVSIEARAVGELWQRIGHHKFEGDDGEEHCDYECLAVGEVRWLQEECEERHRCESEERQHHRAEVVRRLALHKHCHLEGLLLVDESAWLRCGRANGGRIHAPFGMVADVGGDCSEEEAAIIVRVLDAAAPQPEFDGEALHVERELEQLHLLVKDPREMEVRPEVARRHISTQARAGRLAIPRRCLEVPPVGRLQRVDTVAEGHNGVRGALHRDVVVRLPIFSSGEGWVVPVEVEAHPRLERAGQNVELVESKLVNTNEDETRIARQPTTVKLVQVFRMVRQGIG
mmetsp:Transcript_47105/g.124074  ORF Transcript_47105/g.124074 Transcript_47105/m.124074 type:complete len:302 (-) Transcript_47105:181-1086(-)